jgi:hypothetical protein
MKPGRIESARTVGHISHAAQVRVDQRVQDILARRRALEHPRRAAQRVNTGREQDRGAAITMAAEKSPPPGR